MKNNVRSLLVGCLGGALVLGAYKIIESPEVNGVDSPVASTSTLEQSPITKVYNPMVPPESDMDFTYAAENTINTVVHITSEYNASASNTNYYDPFRDFFGGPRSQGPATSSGSGVVISDDGYIITNNHVIEDAEKLTVTLHNKQVYTATVIGTDPSTDLALIKVEAEGLPFIKYGNSQVVKVGEWVLAVGNPFNLNSTVTAGIVSAKGRNINLLEYDPENEVYPLESFIQTDAAVNPGNSGGALINTNGELIGINTAIASRTGSYAGYSFAIPVNIVQKVSTDLLEFGTVQRAFIGVSIRDLNQELAEQLNVTDINGVYVSELTQEGAAETAGIEPGDIIRQVGKVRVNNVPELQEQVARYRPGDKITVVLTRDGRSSTKEVVLRNKDGNTDLIERSVEETKVTTALGASFAEVGSTEMKSLGIEGGVKVTKITGGKLRSSGIREGFIITKIDKTNVNSSDQLIDILENKTGGVLIEGVYPNGMKAYYGFGM